MPRTSRLFCFGYGYSAAALAARLVPKGARIAGTSRTLDGVAALRARGVDAYLFDGVRPMAAGRDVLRESTDVVVSVPPVPGIGDPVLAHHGDDLAQSSALAWLGYLSTTGVYGDRGGDWVNEETLPSPSGERGQARLDAENAWLSLGRTRGVPVHVFRLAGIYGAGRSALDTVREGHAKRIDKPGQVFSRIHVDDIAAVLEASIARPRPGAIYNVCDDEPAAPAEVIAFACELLGVAPPPLVAFDEIAPTLSPMARSFYAENKRVSNARIKAELGVRLRYPDFRAGLRALLEAEGGAR
jgi:dTDP-4-dehydrorhamnose reductase